MTFSFALFVFSVLGAALCFWAFAFFTGRWLYAEQAKIRYGRMRIAALAGLIFFLMLALGAFSQVWAYRSEGLLPVMFRPTATQTPTVTPTLDPNTPTPTPAPSATPTQGPSPTPTLPPGVIINTADLGANIRSEPSVNAPVLAFLEEGSSVLLRQIDNVNADGFEWRAVQLLDGRTGWVVSRYVTAAP